MKISEVGSRQNLDGHRLRLKPRECAGMNAMWWRLFLVGTAVIIVLCLGLLEIAADRASMSQYTTAPGKPAGEPGLPWDR